MQLCAISLAQIHQALGVLSLPVLGRLSHNLMVPWSPFLQICAEGLFNGPEMLPVTEAECVWEKRCDDPVV